MRKANILGTDYKILNRTQLEDKKLEDMDGYCDTSIKAIVIRKLTDEQSLEIDNLEDMDSYFNQVLRHEIVHAFLFESGLHNQSADSWAVNEEIIDWMAIQMPKIMVAYESIVKPVKTIEYQYAGEENPTVVEIT